MEAEAEAGCYRARGTTQRKANQGNHELTRRHHAAETIGGAARLATHMGQSHHQQMMNSWRREWISQNLTPEQEQKEDGDTGSIFNAFLRRTYGGKKFVCAIWQTGASWMPPPGAAEHEEQMLQSTHC